MSGHSAAAAVPRVPAPVVRALGLAVSLAYAGAIGWVYLHQPQTIAEVRGGLASSVGVYRPDPIAFADGLRFFHQDQFVEARLAFDRADAAHRDPTTQFYVAYSFYRQGWGRVRPTRPSMPVDWKRPIEPPPLRPTDTSSWTIQGSRCIPPKSSRRSYSVA